MLSNEELYEGIQLGIIKCNKRSNPRYRFFAKIDKDGPIHPIHGQCWNWKSTILPDGYCNISVNDTQIKAHRLSYEIHIGKIPDGLLVLHKCDNRQCSNPEHLFLGTYQDNHDDCKSKGRTCRGEKNNKCKVTEKIVKEIRRRRQIGGITNTVKKMVLDYGLSDVMIYNIIKSKNWKHVGV